MARKYQDMLCFLTDMRKHLIKLLFSSFTTFLLITAGFYFFVVKPKIELPSTLLEAESTISTNHFNLVQNRLSIVGLANLDPTTVDVAAEKEILLATAKATNEAGLSEFSDISGIKKIIGQDNYAYLINNEIADILPDLLQQNIDVLQRQEDVLSKLSNIAEVNQNIFRYDIERDIGHLHPIENSEEIIERTSSALLGLNEIRMRLDKEFTNDAAKKMSGILEETGSVFQQLIKAIEAEDVEGAGKLFDDLASNFLSMREIGLDMELAVIRSPEVVELLKDQTNLLLEYEYWMDKLNDAQKEISDQTIEPFFNFSF